MISPQGTDIHEHPQEGLRRNDIRPIVESYADGPLSNGVRWRRSQSYDHCYNYFSEVEDLERDMEKSCAILGFYLASWGMYRGSSFLLKHTNSSDLQSVVRVIQQRRERLHAIDMNDYSDDSMQAICESFGEIKTALDLGNHRSITLVTKIMAGVYGCVPAFDRNFVNGFSRVLHGHAKLRPERFDVESLRLLKAFYRANEDEIDRLHRESRTVGFRDSAVTSRQLTRAKIIDMYCFQLGSR